MPAPAEDIKYLYLKVIGGEEVSPAVLAPKCGPIGMPPKKVGDDIKNATKAWKGIKVPVEIQVVKRQVSVTVLPSASSLILKALNEPARNRKTEKDRKHDGNLTIAQVTDLAKEMEAAGKSMSRHISGSVKQLLGTCSSIGCTVESQDPRDVQKKIDSGEYTF